MHTGQEVAVAAESEGESPTIMTIQGDFSSFIPVYALTYDLNFISSTESNAYN